MSGVQLNARRRACRSPIKEQIVFSGNADRPARGPACSTGRSHRARAPVDGQCRLLEEGRGVRLLRSPES